MGRLLSNKKFSIIIAILSGYFIFMIATGQETTEPIADTFGIVDTTEMSVEELTGEHTETAGHEADGDHAEDESAGHGNKEVTDVLLGLIVILLAAKLGGDLFERFKQPAVLGELVIGMVIGNMFLLGIDMFEPFKHSVTLEVLAEIGVIILLFMVGLESSLDDMMKVGAASFMVAVFGVVAPFFLGWGVSILFLPDASTYVHIFIGATLTATSVGITARVLQDIGKIRTREAKIILGAAVIDDIMGLVILAVVTGIITAAGSGDGNGGISSGDVFFIVAKAVGFVVLAIIIGNKMMPYVFKAGSKFKVKGVLLTTALLICFLLSYIASIINLAPIVGAFAAGLIMDKIAYKDFADKEEHSIEDLVKPIAIFLVPVFFVRMGMGVDLTTLANTDILFFAGVLTFAAIIGKQVCSLAIFDKSINRTSIGLGMIPRGEVGLIFAAIGAKLMLDGVPIIDKPTYSAVVIMVMVTTLVTPPLLKISLLKEDKKKNIEQAKA